MTRRNAPSRGLYVGLKGKGPAAGRRGEHPLVLLHAFPLDSRMWLPLAGVLASRGATAHGFDYPGFGLTPAWPDEPPSIDAIADAAVVTLRDGIGAISAHWVGCSMGGYVALAILDRHPDAVAGLGLVGTRSVADDPEGRAKRLAVAAEMDGFSTLSNPQKMAEPLVGTEGPLRSSLVDAATAIIKDASPSAVGWGQRAMAARPDRTDLLRGFAGSAVVAWGDHDGMMGLPDHARMAEALGVGLTIIPGVGHLAPLEAPEAVANALAPLYVG
jgi:pimeloyl-ACP methyl ester carboxylesterase